MSTNATKGFTDHYHVVWGQYSLPEALTFGLGHSYWEDDTIDLTRLTSPEQRNGLLIETMKNTSLFWVKVNWMMKAIFHPEITAFSCVPQDRSLSQTYYVVKLHYPFAPPTFNGFISPYLKYGDPRAHDLSEFEGRAHRVRSSKQIDQSLRTFHLSESLKPILEAFLEDTQTLDLALTIGSETYLWTHSDF